MNQKNIEISSINQAKRYKKYQKKLHYQHADDIYSALKDLTPSAKQVLNFQIYKSFKHKTLFHSQEHIGNATGYHRDTVNIACGVLHNQQMVTKYNRGFMYGRARSNISRVNPLFFDQYLVEALYVQLPALRLLKKNPTLVSKDCDIKNYYKQPTLKKVPTLETTTDLIRLSTKREEERNLKKEQNTQRAFSILESLGLF